MVESEKLQFPSKSVNYCMYALTSEDTESDRSSGVLPSLQRLEHAPQNVDLLALQSRAPEQPAQPRHELLGMARIEETALDHGLFEMGIKRLQFFHAGKGPLL